MAPAAEPPVIDPDSAEPPENERQGGDPRGIAPSPPKSPGAELVAAGLRSRERLRGRLRKLRPLPLGARIVLFLVGWVLVLVGVAGLVLPGIQGVLTIFLGAALLSLVSELIYERLRWLLSRWPNLWRRIEGIRLKLHRRLRAKRPRSTDPPPSEPPL